MACFSSMPRKSPQTHIYIYIIQPALLRDKTFRTPNPFNEAFVNSWHCGDFLAPWDSHERKNPRPQKSPRPGNSWRRSSREVDFPETSPSWNIRRSEPETCTWRDDFGWRPGNPPGKSCYPLKEQHEFRGISEIYLFCNKKPKKPTQTNWYIIEQYQYFDAEFVSCRTNLKYTSPL